jgi:methylaspartate mutase epsilon subunit
MPVHSIDHLKAHSILLGGVGGDSHSVGLNIIRQALIAHHYRVNYLGTQNKLEEFFLRASVNNVVMISCLDGHARYYLREFPELMKKYRPSKTLWYLGGNLEIGGGHGSAQYFREMGFEQVFVKFVDITTVLMTLKKDLEGAEPKAAGKWLFDQIPVDEYRLSAPVQDSPMELPWLERARNEVLESWKTGHEAKRLEENAAFLRRQKSFFRLHNLVHTGRLPILIQPRSGVPTIEEQIKYFKAFQRGGANVLSYQIDSFTRNNNYQGAEDAIRDSIQSRVNTLNGFPAINHGVRGLRRVMAEVQTPLQVRHSTRDPRLLAEISYAGGVTGFEGGAICYCVPYYKDYPLDKSIRKWQYVDRLTGLYYARYGIILDREFFGVLTATLIPPSIAISVNIIEGILAVQQGVKSISLGYAEQGNRVQDIAAIRTMDQMARQALSQLGYKNVQVNTVFNQYMSAFPESVLRAEQLIMHSAVTAKLSAATRVITKTPAEAIKIPTLEDNLLGLFLVRRGVDGAALIPNLAEVEAECEIIRRETWSILDSVFQCGKGNLAAGVVEGFRQGYLDIPFAPSIYNRGEVITARDQTGAVRFLSPGRLQFNREIREFHRMKMSDRRRAEGMIDSRQDYLLVEKDVLRIPRCHYERWPLDA